MTSPPSEVHGPLAGLEPLPQDGPPVTPLGQMGFGYLDLRVFDADNDAYWWDIAGRRHRLTDMTPDYRQNVLAFLERNARYFHLMTIRRGLLELLELGSDFEDGGINPLRLQRLRALLELDPVTWITSTSVALALKNAGSLAPRLLPDKPALKHGASATAKTPVADDGGCPG